MKIKWFQPRKQDERDIRVGVDFANGEAAVVVVEVIDGVAHILHTGLYSEDKVVRP